jgi:hypothetical protein
MTRLRLALLALLLAACGSSRDAVPVADSAPMPHAVPAAQRVLTAPGGVEVWFTDARDATDSTGTACVERVMQIRRDGRQIPIPLLYTGAAPRLVNDSTLEAAIWLHCRPGNVYQVNVQTGRPERVK